MYKEKLKTDSALVIFVWIIFFIFNILMYTMLNTTHNLPDKFKYEGKLQNMLPTFHDLFYGFITFDILTSLLLIFITIDWYLRKKK
ncbi:TPA: hypothetical protein PBF49_001602 [Staphylococcus aureus]|nr:hypothetical protein [Staphylococcus aureus]HEI6472509.1 hypothetical protein [Staphylococcus aureus]HEI6614439.1 hypothetical protein [Staphylococcus aureus]